VRVFAALALAFAEAIAATAVARWGRQQIVGAAEQVD